jgi:hypothetical protein
MKIHKYLVKAQYSGETTTEVILPVGIEIESVSIRYGQLTVELSDGDVLNMPADNYVEIDSKCPDKISFEKVDE